MNSKVSTLPRSQALTVAAIASGVAIVIFALGAVLDAPFLWGINTLSYLPPLTSFILIAISVLLLIPAISTKSVALLEYPFDFRRQTFSWIAFAIAAFTVVLFYRWRIFTDIYGDTRTLIDYLTVHEYSFSDLMNIADENEPLTRLIHQKIAHVLDLDIKSTFQIVSCVAGGISILCVLLFAREVRGDRTWKAALVLGFVTAGINQIYFGHVEDYALPALWATLLLISGWLLLEGRKMLIAFLILFITGLFMHHVIVVYFPAVVYAIYHSVKKNKQEVSGRPRTSRLLLLVGVSLVLAVLVYVFVFEAHVLPHYSSKARLHKVFLPVINPLPVPHSYTLLSPKHISDVVQELWYVISPVTIIFMVVAYALRRRILWHAPEIIFLGLAFLYQLVFTATVDPILSMPRDWDMLSQVALPATFLGAALSRQLLGQLTELHHRRILAGCVLGPALLSATIFYVNTNQDTISKRIQNIGEWSYSSYWVGSSYIINVGQLLIPDQVEEIRRRAETIMRIQHLRSTTDTEFGFLQRKLAERYFIAGKFAEAEQNYQAALMSNPGNIVVEKLLAIDRLMLWKFDQADESITRYNNLANNPHVVDFAGLSVAQFTNHLLYLRRTDTDSSVIQKMIDEMYRLNSGRIQQPP